MRRTPMRSSSSFTRPTASIALQATTIAVSRPPFQMTEDSVAARERGAQGPASGQTGELLMAPHHPLQAQMAARELGAALVWIAFLHAASPSLHFQPARCKAEASRTCPWRCYGILRWCHHSPQQGGRRRRLVCSPGPQQVHQCPTAAPMPRPCHPSARWTCSPSRHLHSHWHSKFRWGSAAPWGSSPRKPSRHRMRLQPSCHLGPFHAQLCRHHRQVPRR
mmetsp:Transcript_33663/g.85051  ORF Transcript_33663/g.85051 Transcript_33663/m.85051 type:complete len:221 (-) Transcript_33663:383-1045(-)